ncbi:MAG TPA: hypothetical protein VL095_16315 [Flavisolibacter sp.]|nr:hypothetical protein [Flavisolibacter sp.]
MATTYSAEKVYLHYDKSSYYAGETIWFKAYLMEGIFPATQTKTLYVDWIDDKGTVLSHTVSPVVDAATNGQFDVPAEYKGDFVHVRAYTKWMLNFDTAFLYSKDIRILPKEASKRTLAAVTPLLQLFPEGGDIVAGVVNKIAFKANDQYGRPVKIKGRLLDNKGTALQSFSSVYDGMGSFVFIPQAGTNYTVKWTDEKNVEHTAILPQAKVSGVSMQVALDGERRIITVNAGPQLESGFRQLHLVGTMNQSLVFKNDISLTENNNVKRIIPTKDLPSGILTLTLFDGAWNAIAERITFVNNHEYTFQPQMEVQHWGLGKRKRNEIEIRLPDSLQDANLSISITDVAIEKDTTENIISHFLLSSEIKGRVYNPAYYFANNSDSVARHLDLVMLTNGWRRFKWEDVVKGKLPQITYPRDTSYLYLSGKLFGVARNQLSGTESIALLVKDTAASKMLIMGINTDGSFGDPNLILFDTMKVYYSLKSKFLSSAEARFMTDRLPAPNYTAFSKNFMYSNNIFDTTGMAHHISLASKALELANIDRGHVMQTVVIQTTKKPTVAVMDEKYTSGMFKGGDGYQFDLVNDPITGGYQNAFSYLQGKVAGLQINTNTTPPSLSWRGGSPAVFLDEIQTDADMVGTIPVTDIAYIKVFRPPFMGGFGGANGAIAIYTRRGSDQTPGKGGLSSNTIAGYSPVKEFYSPNYDRFDPRNERADIRSTLYWAPIITANQNNKSVKLSFYNNDVTKAFRVVIEGMTKDGLLTHYEQIME